MHSLGSEAFLPTAKERQLLMKVKEIGPVGVTYLAEQIGLDKSTVSKRIHKLREKGYVDVQPSAEDSRYKLYFATDMRVHFPTELYQSVLRKFVLLFLHDEVINVLPSDLFSSFMSSFTGEEQELLDQLHRERMED